MDNVGSCPELTPEEKSIWSAEARFLRAYYYTELLKWNGPVIFNGDETVDFNDPDLDKVDRSPWETIVRWVAHEYDLAAEALPDSWGGQDLGRATKGAALAMKARLLLYNASPLFNGQNGTGMYDGVVNRFGVDDPDRSPIENIHEAFISMNSPENIFVRQEDGRAWRIGSTPSGIGGTSYGGVAATQKLVDAFAMENGRYPIANMEDASYNNGLGVIDIDPESGYTETGYTQFVNPFFELFPTAPQTTLVNTMNMYVGREPRFYAWIGYHNGYSEMSMYRLFRIKNQKFLKENINHWICFY